jgi:SAM-dependent methyltransferase
MPATSSNAEESAPAVEIEHFPTSETEKPTPDASGIDGPVGTHPSWQGIAGQVVGQEVLPSQPGKGNEETDPAVDDRDTTTRDGETQKTPIISGSTHLTEKIEENGRTYHGFKDGKYMLPNDEIESNRLEMQHKMWRITLDEKLHLAPIGPDPQNVLDIGCGTGVWASAFADAYPSAQVTGTDLSQPQPEHTPANCTFKISDAEDDWPFRMKFDYIHGRTLATCFADPLSIFRKAYAALRPGGYFEMQDLCLQTSDDGSMVGTTLEAWQGYVREATAGTGRSWDTVPNYKRWMEEAGFEAVTEVRFRWPSNQWADDEKEKLLGAWMQAQVEGGDGGCEG